MTPGPIPRRAVLAMVVLVAVLGLLVVAVLGRSDGSPTASAPGSSSTAAPAPAASEPSTSAPPTPVPPASDPAVMPPVADPGVPVEPVTSDPTTPGPGAPVPVEPAVEEAIAADGSAPVLVRLTVPDGLAPEERAVPVAAAADEVLAALPAASAATAKPTATTAMLALTVDAEGLDALRASASVTAVSEDGINTISSTNSPVSIEAPQAWAQGADGTGQVIAVLDTGVARDHPYLTTNGISAVVDEACFSTSGGGYSSACPSGSTTQYGVGAAAPCPATIRGCEHGTHVAGIAVGGAGAASLASPTFTASGIAPDATLLAVQVFSKGCSGTCLVAFDSDIIRGLDWVYDQRAAYPGLAAVNLSLGGDKYSGSCDTSYPEMKSAIDDLLSGRIATAIASGNSGWRGFVSAPSCISTAVAVGAVDDATLAVAGYSNLSAVVDLLAPGSSIRSSFPPDVMGSLSGTSMAAPAVAGAFAAMAEAGPGLSVDDILSALQASGRSTATGLSRCPATLPYLQLATALDDLAALGQAGYTALAPLRVMDTRFGVGGPISKVGAGSCRTVSTVAAGVPVDAVAVVANVTAVAPSEGTFVTAFPAAGPPNASNLNVLAGQIVPNLVTVKLDGSGRFQLFNWTGEVDLVVDVVGWYRPATGSAFVPSVPDRVLDTRDEGGPIGAGANRTVDATRAGTPVGASAVVANITVTSPSEASWLTAFPSGVVPNASNLNFAPGQTVANLAIVKLAPNGTFQVRNQTGTTHLVVDVVGWFDSIGGAVFTPTNPSRVVDSRTPGGTKLGAGQTLVIDPAGAGVPPTATAIVANLTATQPTLESWLTAFPEGSVPDSSSVNFLAGQTVPNLITVALGADGRFRVNNSSGSTHVIVDVVGWYG